MDTAARRQLPALHADRQPASAQRPGQSAGEARQLLSAYGQSVTGLGPVSGFLLEIRLGQRVLLQPAGREVQRKTVALRLGLQLGHLLVAADVMVENRQP